MKIFGEPTKSKMSNKKSIYKYSHGLVKSLKRKYSSVKKSLKKKSLASHLVEKKIKSNQLKLYQFQQSRQKTSLQFRIFNLATNPELMESILFLIKITICVILLPLLAYLRSNPKKILDFDNVYKFFIDQHFNNISKIISQSVIEHPVAVTFLTEKFMLNPLGKILLKFSLFKSIVAAINHIKDGKEVIEKKIIQVLGRGLFNYETLYSLKYTLEILTPEKVNMSMLERNKYILKCSAIFLTVFDLLLCGTKSSWCNSLKPIQRVTYVFPIFLDLGKIVYKIAAKNSPNKSSSHKPLDLAYYAFKSYCHDSFKLEDNSDDNLNDDSDNDSDEFESMSDFYKNWVSLNYEGPHEMKEESEAKLKLYNLFSEPKKLSKIARTDPNFKTEYINLLLKAQSSQLSLLEPDSNYQFLRKRFGLDYLNLKKVKRIYKSKQDLKKKASILVDQLKDKNKAKVFSEEYRKQFRLEQEQLKISLQEKSNKLLLPSMAQYIPYTNKEFWSKELFYRFPLDQCIISLMYANHSLGSAAVVPLLLLSRDNRVKQIDKRVNNINRNLSEIDKLDSNRNSPVKEKKE